MGYLDSNEAVADICLSLLGDAATASERELGTGTPVPNQVVNHVRDLIAAGEDPLGTAYMEINSPAFRRPNGETYTPSGMVEEMLSWAAGVCQPERVVDCGCGSGRFAVAAARAFPETKVIAIDSSPRSVLMCRAHAQVAGVRDRVKTRCGDFLSVRVDPIEGRTLWIGNPPYVRHHDIAAAAKKWFKRAAGELGLRTSGLAGLHVYFVLRMYQQLSSRDFGILVLSAEWLDVNYGKMLRTILRDMGLSYLHLFSRSQRAFEDVDATAVVVGFEMGKEQGRVHVVTDSFQGDLELPAPQEKWGPVLLGRETGGTPPDGYCRLGEYAQVHRGVATGANSFWVRGDYSDIPESLARPVVAHARDITGEDEAYRRAELLPRLIVLPERIDELSAADARVAERIVREGVEEGIDRGSVARSRRRWWSIKPPKPAPILMTYMTRRHPTFVVNEMGVSMLNVVHGIYPQVKLSQHALRRLTDYLNDCANTYVGRTYAGGLMKFEPREVESFVVPSPELLERET